jgi:hypothetical protein
MPNWLQMGGVKSKTEGDQVPEVTPETINKAITEQKTEFQTKLDALGSKIDEHPTLKAMQTFLDEQTAARQRVEQQRQQQQQTEHNKQFENVDDATRNYVSETLRPLAIATLLQQGNEQRRSIFDNEEEFPYYTGAVRGKIDALLDAQSPEQRANPEVIRNAYKLIVFDFQKDIAENKIKSRFSSASSSGTGTGAPAGDGGSKTPVLTQQMKEVAAKMGMKPEEYATAMQELQLTGEID